MPGNSPVKILGILTGQARDLSSLWPILAKMADLKISHFGQNGPKTGQVSGLAAQNLSWAGTTKIGLKWPILVAFGRFWGQNRPKFGQFWRAGSEMGPFSGHFSAKMTKFCHFGGQNWPKRPILAAPLRSKSQKCDFGDFDRKGGSKSQFLRHKNLRFLPPKSAY